MKSVGGKTGFYLFINGRTDEVRVYCVDKKSDFPDILDAYLSNFKEEIELVVPADDESEPPGRSERQLPIQGMQLRTIGQVKWTPEVQRRS